MLNINNTRQKINNNSLPCVHRRSSCLRSSLFFRLPTSDLPCLRRPPQPTFPGW